MAASIQCDAFGVTVEGGFHANQLRVHIICGGFGHGRQCVWRDTRPGTDADVDTFGERFRPKIRAPGPAGHIALDWRVERIDADFAVAAQDDWLHVAGIEFVVTYEFARGSAEIVN